MLAGQRDEIGGVSDSLYVLVENAHRAAGYGPPAAPLDDSYPARKVFGTPAQELDAEAERVPIGHSAHITHRDRRRLGGTRNEVGAHVGGVGGHTSGRIDEEVDEPAQQAHDLLRLRRAAGRR